MKLKGEIKLIKETQVISDKFRKRELHLNTDLNTEYPQTILLQSTQDRCDLMNGLKLGQEVEVSFNLKGREWTDPKTGEVKIFNTLDVWKIEKVGDEQHNQEEEGDLPF